MEKLANLKNERERLMERLDQIGKDIEVINVTLCVWCKTRPRKDPYALCDHCYELYLKDKDRDKTFRFICPVCKDDLGSCFICPNCGVVASSLMSAPSHCHVCHCQWSYEDKEGVTRCWCCSAVWKESGIDEYINYALKHFDDFREKK